MAGLADELMGDDQETPEAIASLVRGHLGSMVEVMLPGDAEEPVLGAPVRTAVHEWLIEARAIEALAAVNVKPRSSCLLWGPPGCGKTTLAHHFAARVGLPLVVVRAESMKSKYVSASGENIARFFNCMRQVEGRVVAFIDEMDSMAQSRISQQSSAANEQNSIVTALLTNIEGFRGLFFAATNRADALDPAIWRRFGMQIEVTLPGPVERAAIMRRYAAPYVFDEELIARLTTLTAGAAPSLLKQFMEGLKRALVLGPRLRRSIDDLPAMARAVVAQVAPHPDYMKAPFTPPALWENPDNARTLAGLSWPPQIPEIGQ